MEELSAAHLMELVKNKKYKEFRPYIIGIEEQSEAAEKAVVTVLKGVLVSRKNVTPALLLGAMVLYKQVIIGGVMEFVTSEEVFPSSIHKAVGKICEFKSEQTDCYSKGSTYLTETLKLPSSE